LVRVTGQAPLGATIYELGKLRCNLCLEVFNTPPPEGVGAAKYDAGAASMIALLKYGSGVPFYRLEGLQQSLGIVLPASTQWDIVDQGEKQVRPALEELVRQAAQGEVLQNDDTTAKILARMKSAQEDSPQAKAQRTGIYTTCILSRREARTIALFFTGKGHAGENLAQVLTQRAAELAPPIQMCDGLEHNVPKAFQTVLANCLSHSRRKYVEVTPHFPEECRYVLETLAQVYRNDAQCREQKLTPEQRLAFHQSHSQPLMESLKTWLTEQIDEHRVEPNSGLGEAIGYMNKHWKELTLFLRKAGAPLDNNSVEQALKRAILHRKNAYFFRTDRGAEVGDTFMSLIHTCALGEVNAFDYLKALLENAAAVSAHPGQWMPWNWRENFAAPDTS
jgi:transposase